MTIKTYAELAHEHGFKITTVTIEELEDGIGAVQGINFIKHYTFYSPRIFARSIDKEIVFTSKTFNASNTNMARAMALEVAKQDGAIALNIDQIRQFGTGRYIVIFQYIRSKHNGT